MKRFKDIFSAKTFLENDCAGNRASPQLKCAVVLLLWEMACCDGAVTREEFSDIVAQIDHEFHFMDEESKEILDVAAVLDCPGTHFDKYLGEINRYYSPQQREHLMDVVMAIAKADGKVSEREKELHEVLRAKLNLA